MTIALVILAAGNSRRMGDVDKLRCDLGGKPLLQHAVDAAAQSKAKPLLIVHGADKPSVDIPSAQFVYAKHACLGQTHSLHAGLTALARYADITGTLVCLGDMPFVTAAHIDRIYDTALACPQQICRPFFNSLPGHPVYWPRSYFSKLMALQGDNGAKPLFQREPLQKIAVDSDSAVFDVDTLERLEEARRRLVALR